MHVGPAETETPSAARAPLLPASFVASLHSWPRLNLPLQSIPSMCHLLPCPWAVMSPLISAPIPTLSRALVVRLRSITTPIFSSCSQSLAVIHVLSRLQLLPVLGPVPTHTHTHCSSVAPMTTGSLCSTSALLELRGLRNARHSSPSPSCASGARARYCSSECSLPSSFQLSLGTGS